MKVSEARQLTRDAVEADLEEVNREINKAARKGKSKISLEKDRWPWYVLRSMAAILRRRGFDVGTKYKLEISWE